MSKDRVPVVLEIIVQAEEGILDLRLLHLLHTAIMFAAIMFAAYPICNTSARLSSKVGSAFSANDGECEIVFVPGTVGDFAAFGTE